MKFCITKKFIGDPDSTLYYTGIDDKDLEFSTEKSDAETFESLDICWHRYEPMRSKLSEKDITKYYLLIESMEECN